MKITLSASRAARLIHPWPGYLNGYENGMDRNEGEIIEKWVANNYGFELNTRIFNNNFSLGGYQDYRSKDCLVLNAKPDGIKGNQIIEVKSGSGKSLEHQRIVGEDQVILSALAAEAEIRYPEPVLILVDLNTRETEEVYMIYDRADAMTQLFEALEKYAQKRKIKSMSNEEVGNNRCLNQQHYYALGAAHGFVPQVYNRW